MTRGNYKLVKPGIRVWDDGMVEVRTTVTFDPAQDAGLIVALQQSQMKTSKLIAELVRLGFDCEPVEGVVEDGEEVVEEAPADEWQTPDISIEL